MILNAEEQKSIEQLSKQHPEVHKLWYEYQRLQEDGIEMFISALNEKMKGLAMEVSDTSVSLHDKDKQGLNKLLKTIKEVAMVATKMKALQNQKLNGKAKTTKKEDVKKDEQEEGDSKSFLDRKVNKQRTV